MLVNGWLVSRLLFIYTARSIWNLSWNDCILTVETLLLYTLVVCNYFCCFLLVQQFQSELLLSDPDTLENFSTKLWFLCNFFHIGYFNINLHDKKIFKYNIVCIIVFKTKLQYSLKCNSIILYQLTLFPALLIFVLHTVVDWSEAVTVYRNMQYDKYEIQEICNLFFCRKLPERQMDDWKLKSMPVVRLGQLSKTFV